MPHAETVTPWLDTRKVERKLHLIPHSWETEVAR